VFEAWHRLFAFNPNSAEVPPNSGRTPVNLPDLSKQFLKVVSTKGHEYVSAKDDLVNRLLRPDEVDPLSFVQTDEILAYASMKGRPLVADLPDGFDVESSALATGQAPMLEAVGDEIEAGTVLAEIADQRYTLLKPAEPVRSRAIRLDRRALAALLGAARQKLTPSADDLGEFAAVTPEPDASWICDTYLRLLDPTDSGRGQAPMDASDDKKDWRALRFYGSLSSDLKALLQSGKSFPAASLNEIQLRFLSELVYGASAKLSIVEPDLDDDMDADEYRAAITQQETDLEQLEPTDLAPNGLYTVANLRFLASEHLLALPEQVAGPRSLGGYGALAAWDFAQAKSDFAEGGNGTAPPLWPQLFRTGVETRFVLEIHVTPKVSTGNAIVDRRFPKDTKPVAESGLPADFLKEMEKNLEEIRTRPDVRSRDGDSRKIHPR
jgi:hypothetical protein